MHNATETEAAKWNSGVFNFVTILLLPVPSILLPVKMSYIKAHHGHAVWSRLIAFVMCRGARGVL